MIIVKKISQMRSLIAQTRARCKTIGFVPTMGAFHEGHLSLFRRSGKENDLSVVSIFVNPLQFGPAEDFQNYPRQFKTDEKFAKKGNVDIIFYPSEKEMYPDRYLTYIQVHQLTEGLCGRSRPGHFRGVTTVIGKLLNIITPQVMYLGHKDYQQALVLEKMAKDLNFHCQVKILPTIREKNGLAMSSRNHHLTEQQRNEAPALYQSLQLAHQLIHQGERRPKKIIQAMKEFIEQTSSGRVDYIECVNAQNLKPCQEIQGTILIALAAWFNRTRLIDNTRIRIT